MIPREGRSVHPNPDPEPTISGPVRHTAPVSRVPAPPTSSKHRFGNATVYNAPHNRHHVYSDTVEHPGEIRWRGAGALRLTVLGGSAAGPNTGQGCSGYLIETGATALVLDLGPGTLTELRRHVDYRLLHGIVVSHLHLDHVLDLLALRFLLAYNPIGPPGKVPLWLPPNGRDFLRRAAATFAQAGEDRGFFEEVYDVAEYDPSGVVELGEARVRFQSTIHYLPCWALRVDSTSEPACLLYTADTGPAVDLAGIGRGAQLIVAEATLLDPGNEPFAKRGHLTASEAAEIATSIGAETLVLSHLWEELGFERYRQQAASRFDGRIEVARAGLRVEW